MSALLEWHQRLLSNSLLASPLRLSELLNPAFFLTALRQQTARQDRVPMDSLRLACALDPSQLGGASLRFAIDGLLLQGATCTPQQGLVPLAAEDATFAVVPALHLAWVPNSQPETYPLERSAKIPVYLNPQREAALAELRLPCSGNEMQWLQAGAALFLSE